MHKYPKFHAGTLASPESNEKLYPLILKMNLLSNNANQESVDYNVWNITPYIFCNLTCKHIHACTAEFHK